MRLQLFVIVIIIFVLFSCSDNNTNEPANGVIKGKVISSFNQEPVEGANITTNPSTESLITDENGQFEINNVNIGEYTVYAQKSNYKKSEVVVTVKSGQITQANLVLIDTINSKYGAIEGIVVDYKTNEPLEDVLISSTPKTTSTKTDKNGQFKINYIPTGNYKLKFEKNDYTNKTIEINITAGQTNSIYVQLFKENKNNHPPDIPILLSPAEGEFIDSDNVILRWECSDPDGDSLKYDIYLSQSNPPDNVIKEDYGGTSLEIKLPFENTIYYWKVIAKDEPSNSQSASVINSFTFYQSSTINKDLILYYNFDKKDAKDISGHSNDGILHNNVEFVHGVLGYAAYLKGNNLQDGNGAYIELPVIDFKKYPEFTIALWIKEEKAFQNVGQPYIAGEAYINWGIHSEGWIGIGNYSLPPENKYRAINFSVGAISEWWERIPLWQKYDTKYQNQWTHYALVFKNGTVYGYINGHLIGSKPQVIYKIDNYAAIGKHWWYLNDKFMSSTSLIFSVDEVRVYKTALTSVDILHLSQYMD